MHKCSGRAHPLPPAPSPPGGLQAPQGALVSHGKPLNRGWGGVVVVVVGVKAQTGPAAAWSPPHACGVDLQLKQA